MRSTIFGGLGFSDIVSAAMQNKKERNLDSAALGESTRYAGKWRHKMKAARGLGFKGGQSRQSDQEQGAGWMGLEEERQDRGNTEGAIVL
jgi:hypothetical protein